MKRIRAASGAALIAAAAGMYGAYRTVFGRNGIHPGLDHEVPHGKQYDSYTELLERNIEKAAKLPFRQVQMKAYDGIILSGNYYHFREGAPLIIFFHGYRSSAVRDGNSLLLFAQKNGYNTLLVHQRGHGTSEGRTITFGIRERYDCAEWVRYALREFGKETKIILAGISMGASTILMAADLGLPDNVKGMIADCGFSAPKEILRAVMKQMKYPVGITYAVVRLGAKIFGRFDVEEYSALEAMEKCTIPILFIHGNEDYFVPCEMSRACYEACAAEKKLILVEGAAHGISYCVDSTLYEKEVYDFFERVL